MTTNPFFIPCNIVSLILKKCGFNPEKCEQYCLSNPDICLNAYRIATWEDLEDAWVETPTW